MSWPGKALIVVFLLLGIAELSAQSTEYIPFDYFYGRIIGHSYIQAVHDTYNDEYGSIDASLSVGNGDHAQVSLGRLLSLYQTSYSDRYTLKIYRPELSAQIQPKRNLRWHVNSLDWKDDLRLNAGSTSLYRDHTSSFSTNQWITWLKRDISYRAERSFYTYLQSFWLDEGNMSLSASGELDIVDNSGFNKALIDLDSVLLLRGDSTVIDGRSWALAPDVIYGLSENANVRVSLKYGRSVTTNVAGSLYPSIVDSQFVSYENWQTWKRVSRYFAVTVEPIYHFAPSHWISLQAAYYDMTADDDAEDGLIIDTVKRRDTRSQFQRVVSNKSLGLMHAIALGAEPIPYRQILDDWSRYYGRRLSPGSFLIETSVSSSCRKENNDGTTYYGDTLSAPYAEKTHHNSLNVLSRARYFSHWNLDPWMSLMLSNSNYGRANDPQMPLNRLYGNLQFQFGVDYFSYRWLSDRRREIGWDAVNDIDYLLGPLLRKYDWKTALSVFLPVNVWRDSSSSESAFKLHGGESDDHWVTTLKTSCGTGAGVELGMEVQYDQNIDYEHWDESRHGMARYDTWDVILRFKWQPGNRFRLDFMVGENYQDRVSRGFWNNQPYNQTEYRRTSRINVKYNILL